MTRMNWRMLIGLAMASAGVIAWVVFPATFAHGVIVGFFMGPGVIMGGMALFAWRRLKRMRERKLKPPPLSVGSWDYEMECHDLAGEAMEFSRFSGKVLVLNFWATRDPSCVTEMSSLQRLQEATSDLDVELACVTRERPAKVRKFVEKSGLAVPVYVLSDAPPGCFAGRWIPHTSIIDKTGVIALHHVGAASWDDESVVGFVRGLAAH